LQKWLDGGDTGNGFYVFRTRLEDRRICINISTPTGDTIMRLAEIAADLEQRRIAILKNSADRAKKQMKDAQARYKMKKAQEQLNKFRSTVASYSLIG